MLAYSHVVLTEAVNIAYFQNTDFKSMQLQAVCGSACDTDSIILRLRKKYVVDWRKKKLLCADSSPEGITNLGAAATHFPDLGPLAAAELELHFLALRSGILQLPDIVLSEGEQQLLLDSLSLHVKVE